MRSSILSLLFFISFSFEVHAEILVKQYFGEWCVSSVERYRGGLTVETEAKSKIGSKLELSSKGYRSFHSELDSPVFKANSEAIHNIEGVVQEKNSLFYGVFPNRSKLEVIKVFEASDLENAWTELEIINNQSFFELYDGFVYVYEKCS